MVDSGSNGAFRVVFSPNWGSRLGVAVLATMGKSMRVFLYSTQRVDIDGGRDVYKAPGYFNAPKELAEKWIGLGLAVEATLDNTHVDLEPIADPIFDKRPKGIQHKEPEAVCFSKRPKGPQAVVKKKTFKKKKRKKGLNG